MVRIASIVLVLATVLVPGICQKKPDPKPESAPASQPAAAPAVGVDPELQKEIDGLGAALNGAKVNCVAGKTFDFIGTITESQLTVLMEIADRTFKTFEDVTSEAGGVAGERATGSTAVPAGKTPAQAMFGGRKCLVAVFANAQQYQTFGKWYDAFFKWTNAEAMKTHTYFPYAWPRSAIVTHLRPHDLNMLKNVIAHEVGHMCAYRYAYNNNEAPVWFTEGLATCLEGRALGTTNCYCFSGGYGDASAQSKNLVNREWGKWKAQVKTLVKGKQDKAIQAILPMPLNELTMNETGKAMAVVDYWMKTDPAKMIRWLALTKKYWPEKYQYEWSAQKGEAQAKALKEVFGIGWPELDDAVRKYVQASY